MPLEEGKRTKEIEITFKVIAAGEEAFTDFDSRFESPAEAAMRVYEAMLKASPNYVGECVAMDCAKYVASTKDDKR